MDQENKIKLAELKLKQARTWLLLEASFFGSQSIKRELIVSDNYNGYIVKTACTNGKVICYNADYALSRSQKQVIFDLVHEVLHIMFLHNLRIKGRDINTYNIAADYIVNGIIMQNDVLIKKGIAALENITDYYHDIKFNGMSVEQVYKILTDQDQDTDQDTDQDQDQDQDKIIDQEGISVIPLTQEDLEDNEDLKDFETEVKADLCNAFNFAKKTGQFPGTNIEKIIKDIISPPIPFEEALRQWFDDNSQDDFSFCYPSRRSTNDFILPGMFSEALGKIILSIDVSISVTSHLKALDNFQSQINYLRSVFNFETTVIYWHDKVCKVENFTKDQEVILQVPETGLTEITPLFEYIEDNGLQNSITGVIHFTDLYISDFPKYQPAYKNLFVVYGSNKRPAPFGDTLHIDN